NWTRPDNIWQTLNLSNLITSCTGLPELQPVGADHMSILTVLNLSVPRLLAEPTCNFGTADFDKFCETLKANLDLNCKAHHIIPEDNFIRTVDLFVMLIQETIELEVPLTKPSLHSKCWWTNVSLMLTA
ncbi:hypothetical protein FIBSPDRAFT_746116, partial [Athelia psychrophila]